MLPIRIHHNDHVLVCDGSKALLLQNNGETFALDLEVVEVAVEPHPPSHELGSERPGRVHESVGVSRSSVRSLDRHEAAEANFLKTVARRLDDVLRSRRMQRLILVAPAKALGELRACLSPEVKAVVAAEASKDLARLSTAKIEEHLAALSRLS